jgi:hypothetical protein
MIARSVFLRQYTLFIAFRMTALHFFISVNLPFLISGLRLEVNDNCALLGYYAASSGNSLPTFRDKLSVKYSGVNPWRLDPMGCPETSVRNYHYWLRNNPEERSYQLIVHTLNFLIDRICFITHLQAFRFTPLVVLIWCSFRSYNLQYHTFVQKCSNILLPPSSGWLGFLKLFAEAPSGGTPSIVFWPVTAVDNHHRVARCHSQKYLQPHIQSTQFHFCVLWNQIQPTSETSKQPCHRIRYKYLGDQHFNRYKF